MQGFLRERDGNFVASSNFSVKRNEVDARHRAKERRGGSRAPHHGSSFYRYRPAEERIFAFSSRRIRRAPGAPGRPQNFRFARRNGRVAANPPGRDELRQRLLTPDGGVCYYNSCRQAEVAELADALRSGRSGLHARVGSNPSFGTRHTENRSTERFSAFRGAVARRVFCLFAPCLPLRYSFQRTLRKYRIAADMPWQLGNSRATVAAPSPTRTIISAMRDKLVVK